MSPIKLKLQSLHVGGGRTKINIPGGPRSDRPAPEGGDDKYINRSSLLRILRVS